MSKIIDIRRKMKYQEAEASTTPSQPVRSILAQSMASVKQREMSKYYCKNLAICLNKETNHLHVMTRKRELWKNTLIK